MAAYERAPSDKGQGTPSDRAQDPRDGKNLRIMANLQHVLDLKRIHALVKFEYDGPQLRVYRCAPRLDVAPERIERLAGTFAQAAYATDCTVAKGENGTLLIEIAKSEEERYMLPAPGLRELPTPRATAVPIGIGSAGAAQWLDLADERHVHTLICGTTGSGKSVCLRWLLYRLFAQNSPRALRVLLLDPKRELEAFAGLPHLLHPPASRPLEIASLLAWAVAELDRRIATRSASPRLVIVAEEIADLILIHPAIGDYLTRIAQVGRSVGLNLMGTAQQPNLDAVGKSTVNFTARIVGRVATAALAYGATGRAGLRAEKLLGRGDMLLVAGAEVTRIQVPYCGAERLLELPRMAEPASLADELPALVDFGERRRQPLRQPLRRGPERNAIPLTHADDAAASAWAADLRAERTRRPERGEPAARRPAAQPAGGQRRGQAAENKPRGEHDAGPNGKPNGAGRPGEIPREIHRRQDEA